MFRPSEKVLVNMQWGEMIDPKIEPTARTLQPTTSFPYVKMATDPLLNHPLSKFLEGHISNDKHLYSMTGMQGGKWYISDAEYPKFFELLNDYIFIKKYRPLNLVEQRVTDYRTPLLIDLDFKYPIEKSLIHSFSRNEIFSFVNDVCAKLLLFFDFSDKKVIRFFITLRPEAYIAKKKDGSPGKEVKDGIHIESPDIVLTSEQQKVLRIALCNDGAVAKAFASTGYKKEEKDVDIYDESLVQKNGWFFYGESKQDVPPYQLEYVFRYTLKTGKWTDEAKTIYSSETLMEILSIRYNLKEPLKVKAESQAEFTTLLEPLIAPPRTTTTQNILGNVIGGEDIGAWQHVLASVHPESDIDMMRRCILECFSEERADNYNSWMKVGWAIRNIDESEEGFNLWMDFSRKSKKFSENNVATLRRDWMRGAMMRPIHDTKSITLGSIIYWAQQDNPVQWHKIKNEDTQNYIKKVALSFKGGTHHHCAAIMRKVFGDNYRCSVDHKSYEWFRYTGNIWEPLPQGIELKNKMSIEIAEHVMEAKKSHTTAMLNNKSLESKDSIDQLNKFLELEKNLYNANFKESVMKECVQEFYEEGFGSKLNTNSFLIGCANGILHLRDPVYSADGSDIIDYQVVLKPGKPTDYVSFRAGHLPPELDALEYEEYNPEDPNQKELMEFFCKLFPDEELRHYVLVLASSCLEGQNREQCYYILTGVGSNGKSKFSDLMRDTLGEYVSTLSTTALTRKRPESGAANPDIISVKNKRFIYMQEPDESEKLNTSRMKQFSGEDIVEARGLFKDQERFKISGKLFMACNRLPPITSMDGGTWRRIRVIPFKAEFLDAGHPRINPSNNVYMKDLMLGEKLKKWRKAFFSLLVHYYKAYYMKDGIKKVPTEVRKESEKYKNSHDAFGKFRSSLIRDANTAPADKKLSLMEHSVVHKRLKSAYNKWATDGNGSRLTENELKIRSEEAFGSPADGMTYKGVRLFDNEDEVESWDRGEID